MLEKPTSSPKLSSAILTCFLLLLTGCNNGEAMQSFLSPDPQLSNSQDTTTNNSLPSSTESNNPIETEAEESETSGNEPENQFESNLPLDFPPEIPLYPEAMVEAIELQGEEAGTVIWRSQNDIELIASYYQEEFNQNDWEIIQPFQSDLEESERSIIASKDNLKVKVALVDRQLEETLPTQITIAYKPFDNSLLPEETNSESIETLESNSSAISTTNFSDLDEVAEQLQPAVTQVAALDVLTPYLQDGQISKFAPNESITRRDYARWLIAANNKYYTQSPGKKIRLATASSELAFQDIKPNDPDFGVIQGLAEAGLIPSILTQESDNLLFRPDAPLTREDLLVWKVPLDIRKALPKASIENIQESWGFQDTTKISISGLRALFADFQNGDRANVRRMFGYTTLFQPKKPVTRGEAAASLWYFGFQGDGITAQEVLKVESNIE